MGGGAFIGRDAKTDFTRWYSTSFADQSRKASVVVATKTMILLWRLKSDENVSRYHENHILPFGHLVQRQNERKKERKDRQTMHVPENPARSFSRLARCRFLTASPSSKSSERERNANQVSESLYAPEVGSLRRACGGPMRLSAATQSFLLPDARA